MNDVKGEVLSDPALAGQLERVNHYLDGLPGVDLRLCAAYPLRPDRLIRYLAAFKASFEHCVSQVKGAIARQQRDEAYRLMHTLKGTAAQLGFVHIRSLAQAIEVQCQEAAHEGEYTLALDTLDIELQKLILCIDQVSDAK